MPAPLSWSPLVSWCGLVGHALYSLVSGVLSGDHAVRQTTCNHLTPVFGLVKAASTVYGGLGSFTPWAAWFPNRLVGVVPAKGLSWPSVDKPLVRFKRLLAFLPRVCAFMRLGWDRPVAFLTSGSPIDVALRLALPACWV